MKLDRFIAWFEWLLKWEGTVFENDPDDPGGATKYGIDQRSHPRENIRQLTKARAAEIYRAEYWGRVRADEMPPAVGEVVANIAVNCGIGRAAKWLQRAVGASEDGIIGDDTIRRTNAMSDAKTLARALIARTQQHYRDSAKGRLAKFLTGWTNRNNDLARFIGV